MSRNNDELGLLLPLQFFAEPGQPENKPEDKTAENNSTKNENPDGQAEDKPEGNEPPKTYTKSEVDAEISRAVATALTNREKKESKTRQAEIDKAVKTALERAKMTEEERINADLIDRETAIAEREKLAERREYMADVTAELAVQGLPKSFAEMIVNSYSRDDADIAIKTIKDEVDALITEQIKNIARQPDAKAPGLSAGVNTGGTTSLKQFADKMRKVK